MFCIPIPIPRTRQRETSDSSPRNKGGNVHVFGSSRSLHPLRFHFPDDKSGFKQSNVLSRIRFITTGSILCTPPSYLPMVSTMTIYNDVLVSQYIGFYGSYALLGVPAPFTSAIKPGDLPVAIFFL